MVNSQFANLTTDKVTMDMGNGKTISFFAPSIQESLQTVGANGVTGRSAYILQQLAEQLKAEGDLSAEEYQDLVRLSQVGYNLQGYRRYWKLPCPTLR